TQLHTATPAPMLSASGQITPRKWWHDPAFAKLRKLMPTTWQYQHSIHHPFRGEHFAMVGHAFFRLDQAHGLFMSAGKALSKGVLIYLTKCPDAPAPARPSL
ncbi:hypothetical protein, partial [Roseovarius sp. A-2]|uniref:hypothetical protein n=1 Tax=Roseovarius sp. A-2 TaxID=1570360 RepID=UPI001C393858